MHGGYHRCHGKSMDGAGAYIVNRGCSDGDGCWATRGTGLAAGDAFGGVDAGTGCRGVGGYEADGCAMRTEEASGRLVPTGDDGTPAGFVIVGHQRDVRWGDEWAAAAALAAEAGIPADADRRGGAAIGFYRRAACKAASSEGRGEGGGPFRGIVFNAGSCDWIYGCVEGDPAVQQITLNVLRSLGGVEVASDE